jgi:hypothetical protein
LIRDEPEHPRASEEYYKVMLGPLVRLPGPIDSGKWKRFTFIYTNGALLQHANTLSDLTIRAEERPLFWRILRERALQSGAYLQGELPEFPLDDALLTILASGFSIKEEQAWYYSE